MIIAVDFDGTVVEHRYPEIGEERLFAIDTLKAFMREGHQLVLWSVREGKLLDDAVEWCRQRGVEFYAVTKTSLKKIPARTNTMQGSSGLTSSSMTETSAGCLTGAPSIAW